MRTALLTLSVVLMSVGTVLAQQTPLGRERPLAVLFLGNSYTFGNDLPGLIAGLAEAAGARAIETALHAPGGYTFEMHVLDGKALEKIARQKWDVVVLQEQSLRPVMDPNRMHNFARTLHEAIAKQGAKTLFFLTWARQAKPEMQQKIDDAYFAIAKELGAGVVPVGMAWQRAIAADAKLSLYDKDGSRPSVEGSYLAACVFYAVLLDKSPVGLPAEVKHNGKTLAKLDPAEARQLQTAAWETVQEMRTGRR